MIELNVQIKLIIFSLIYGFLFSIILDIIYPFKKKRKKVSRLGLSFLLVMLMAIVYFVAIDKIGYVIFHIYSIFAIIVGFIMYDILISVIAKKNKK